MEAQGKIPRLTCQNCGHTWIPRVESPRKCPECQSRDWDVEDGGEDWPGRKEEAKA